MLTQRTRKKTGWLAVGKFPTFRENERRYPGREEEKKKAFGQVCASADPCVRNIQRRIKKEVEGGGVSYEQGRGPEQHGICTPRQQ